jgi:hypothetical protein
MKARAGKKCSFKSFTCFLRIAAIFSARVLIISKPDYLVESSKSLFLMIYEMTKMSFGMQPLQTSP